MIPTFRPAFAPLRVLATAVALGAALAAGAATPAHAQSRTQIAGGFGIASGLGSLADLTGVGMSGTIGVGFPRGDRFTFWLEGSAEGLPSDSDPLVEQGGWQYSTRYLAAAEYRFTRPWSPWRASASLGVGATTFWDNSWAMYSIDEDGFYDFNTASVVELTGTHFTVAPGFRAAYELAPTLDLELVGRVNMALYGGEAFAVDTAGVYTDIEPPGSPITSWGVTLGTRLRAGGAPSDWVDLEPGDRVRAWTLSGHEIEGRLVSAKGGRLRLASGRDSIDVALDGLQSAAALYTKADHGGVLGAAILGGAGIVLGALATGVGCSVDDSASGCSTGDWVAGPVALGLTGAVAGFFFGSLLGSLSEQWSDLSVR
jgi:hypothetical protein